MLCLVLVSSAASAQVAVRGETVHTMAGASIAAAGAGRQGRQGRAGRAGVKRPIPSGYKLLRAKVATPGLVDAHSVVGFAGYLEPAQEQMQLETSAAIQPELRAIDAYNARESLVGVAPQFTVSPRFTRVTDPVRWSRVRRWWSRRAVTASTQSVIVPAASVAATLGADGLAGQGKSRGMRSKAVAMLAR